MATTPKQKVPVTDGTPDTNPPLNVNPGGSEPETTTKSGGGMLPTTEIGAVYSLPFVPFERGVGSIVIGSEHTRTGMQNSWLTAGQPGIESVAVTVKHGTGPRIIAFMPSTLTPGVP